MFKKSFMMMMALFLVLFAAGCGNKETPKAAADKPEYSADKAILGYAELSLFGNTEHLKETGLTETDAKQYKDKVFNELSGAFSDFPLSKDSIDSLINHYVTQFKKNVNFKVELVKDDPENPVVKLTGNVINQKEMGEITETNEDLKAIGTMMGELMVQGLSAEDLKNNADFQKATLEHFGNFINAFPVNKEVSVEVTCQKRKGLDGKFYWEPKDKTVIENFGDKQ